MLSMPETVTHKILTALTAKLQIGGAQIEFSTAFGNPNGNTLYASLNNGPLDLTELVNRLLENSFSISLPEFIPHISIARLEGYWIENQQYTLSCDVAEINNPLPIAKNVDMQLIWKLLNRLFNLLKDMMKARVSKRFIHLMLKVSMSCASF